MSDKTITLSPDQWAEYMTALREHNAGLLQAAQDSVQKQADFIAGDHERNLRDRMAMCAIEGLLASGEWQNGAHDVSAHIANIAYQFADAMLEARK